MPRLAALLLAALLFAAAPPVRSDAGGGDLPDRWQDAVDVSPGTYEGALGGGDKADWVRTTHPEGKALRATLLFRGAQLSLSLDLRNDSGGSAQLDGGALESDGDLRRVVKHANASSGVRVGVTTLQQATVAYTLVLEVVDLPNAVVAGLRVRHVPADAPPEAGDVSLRRVVEVDVANAGGAALRADLDLVVESVFTTGDYLGRRLVDLAPGESRTYTYEWTGHGAGDYRLRALVRLHPGPPEANAADNVGIAHDHLLVGGLGTGVVVPVSSLKRFLGEEP